MSTEPSPARLSGNEQIVEHALGEVRTFIDELKNGTRKYKTIASLGGQIAEAYRGRCVLELLQNAHDALADTPGGEPGLVIAVGAFSNCCKTRMTRWQTRRGASRDWSRFHWKPHRTPCS